eukprot:290346-Alexandrium_andersonii.AAC.1
MPQPAPPAPDSLAGLLRFPVDDLQILLRGPDAAMFRQCLANKKLLINTFYSGMGTEFITGNFFKHAARELGLLSIFDVGPC